MRTNRFYEERTLDLRELWKKAGRTAPGSIQELPREGDSVNGSAQTGAANQAAAGR